MRWVQPGKNIVDDDLCCFFYAFENSVDLSNDGSRVGSSETQGTNLQELPVLGSFEALPRYTTGSAQKMCGCKWVRPFIRGQILPHELIFGYSTTISSDGKRIAGGAPSGRNNYVQAYELDMG